RRCDLGVLLCGGRSAPCEQARGDQPGPVASSYHPCTLLGPLARVDPYRSLISSACEWRRVDRFDHSCGGDAKSPRPRESPSLREAHFCGRVGSTLSKLDK